MFFPEFPILDYLHLVTPDWMYGGFPKLSSLYQDYIDFTLTSCEQVRNWIVETGGNAGKIKTCYIGVDPEIWKPDPTMSQQVRTEYGIGLRDIVILFAARLEEQKQPKLFVETLCKLKKKGVGFYALIAGEGSLKSVLDDELYANDMQVQIRILGRIPTEKMPAIMAASDIFFLPSQNEGISQALYEAMSCGLVVVGAQVGGQDELVSPECGILHLPGGQENEADEYADILYELICDTPRRQQMSQASRMRILEKFTTSMMGEYIHRKLNEVIDIKKGNVELVTTKLDRQSINREIQTAVEYLQVRQELRILNRRYSSLVLPKTASHWFYLWIRQVLLPIYNWISRTKLLALIIRLKQTIKHRLTKDS
jgi:glycosyltransferase involved in cell wall biosynthesis